MLPDALLIEMKKSCADVADEIERQLFGDDNELSDEKKAKIEGNTNAKLPNQT